MYLANSFNEIDYSVINNRLKKGAKLRLDIGTSICSPVSKFWLDNCVEDIFIIEFGPNPDCVHKNNFWVGRYMNVPETFRSHPRTDSYYHVVGGIDNVEALSKAKFYKTTVNVGCSSLLKPIIENISGCGLDDEIEVDVFSAKLLLDNIDYDLIEMVKIDAQGKDLDIVKSFGEHLSNVIFLDVESDSSMYYENAPSFDVINSGITKLGFELYQNMHVNLRYKNSTRDMPTGFNNITGML